MTTHHETDVSIWLVPRQPERSQLEKIIKALATTHDSHPFIPHITLYYLLQSVSAQETSQLLEGCLVGQKPIEVTAEALEVGQSFIKRLYIQYKNNPQLEALYSRLRQALLPFHDYHFTPHLSLAYSTNFDWQPPSDLTYPKNLVLDTVMIVTKPGKTIATELDILLWHTYQQWELPMKDDN